MNIVLWFLQIMLVLLIGMGSVNQLFNFEDISRQYAPYKALPRTFWTAYAIIALACAIGLLSTRISPKITAIAAMVFFAQSLAFAAIYAHSAGFKPSIAMWAVWTLGPAAVAGFIAYGRFEEVR